MAKYCFIFLVLFFLSGTHLWSQKDTTARTYEMELTAAYPFPASAITFENNYKGIIQVTLNAQNYIYNHIFAGVSFGYEQFNINQKVVVLNTRLSNYLMALRVGWKYNVYKSMFLTPVLAAGYALMEFKNPDLTGTNTLEEGGPLLRAGLKAGYDLTSRLSLGLDGLYQLIFVHFGVSNVAEDSTTRSFAFGISATYKI